MKPSGPRRENVIATIRPTTVGGNPMPALKITSAARRPKKRFAPTKYPTGSPMRRAIAVADPETSRDVQTICQMPKEPEVSSAQPSAQASTNICIEPPAASKAATWSRSE